MRLHYQSTTYPRDFPTPLCGAHGAGEGEGSWGIPGACWAKPETAPKKLPQYLEFHINQVGTLNLVKAWGVSPKHRSKMDL